MSFLGSSVRRWACVRFGVVTLVVIFASCSSDERSGRREIPEPTGEAATSAVESTGKTSPVSQQQLVQSILAGAPAADTVPAFAAAVQRVHELGGAFEFDAAGRVAGIDLTVGRVSVMAADMLHLPAFEHLVRLRVSSGDAGNAEVAALTHLKQLRQLALRNTKIDAEGLRRLSELPELVSLDLQRSVNLKDDAFAVFAEFPKLEELILVEGVFTDAALDHLPRIPELQQLDLRSCSGLTAAGWQKLAQISRLRSLKIAGPTIDDSTLPVLAKLSQLSSLTIEDAAITGAGLESLTNLPLEDLSLARCFGISDEALAGIGRMSELRQLYIRDILISGSGLGHLASLTRLSTLRLRQTGVGDAVLGELAKLPALRRLELTQAWISDDGLASLGQLKALTHLDLEENRLSDEGVQHLSGLVHLERLSLARNESVSDAAMEVFAQFPQLSELDLQGTSVGEAAITAFRARRPECRVLK